MTFFMLSHPMSIEIRGRVHGDFVDITQVDLCVEDDPKENWNDFSQLKTYHRRR